MAIKTVQQVVVTGLNPSFSAAAGGGDEFANSGKVYYHVKNGGGGSINVTVNSQAACNQGFDHDLVVAVPAAGERIIGPFSPHRFNDVNDRVQVTYSGVTSVTVAAIEVP